MSFKTVLALIIIAAFIYILQGCGTYHQHEVRHKTYHSKPCTVKAVGRDGLIVCPDGTSLLVRAKTKVVGKAASTRTVINVDCKASSKSNSKATSKSK